MHHLTFETTDQDFGTQVLQSTLPVLIEFTADWCPPCKMLAPIINEIAHKYEGKLRVGLLDSDINPEMVQQYGVMGLPTLILFVDGLPAERIIGYTPRERIEAKILPHLAMQNA
jgi:thioredoxin 1